MNPLSSHYGGAKVTHDFSEIFTQKLSYGYLDQDLMGETYTILNDTIEAGTKSIFKYMKHMELVAGYDYLYQRGRAAVYDKDTTTHSFYAEHLASLDPFFVTLGIRNDDHSEFGDETTYRASLSYELNQYTLLHTSYGTGFKAPTLNDLFWPFQDFGIFGSYQGNPNLKPETSKGWDFGIRNNFMDGAIKTDVTYFYNEIDVLIIYATGFPGPFDGSLINVDEAKTQGVEVSADFMIYDKLAVGLAYTYTDTEDLSDSSRLPRRPLHTIAGNVHYYANDKLDFGFDLSSQNGRTNTSDELMEGFTRIDFVLNYAPEDDLLFFIKVHNMFDEAYEEVDNFGSSGSHSSAGVKFIF